MEQMVELRCEEVRLILSGQFRHNVLVQFFLSLRISI